MVSRTSRLYSAKNSLHVLRARNPEHIYPAPVYIPGVQQAVLAGHEALQYQLALDERQAAQVAPGPAA